MMMDDRDSNYRRLGLVDATTLPIIDPPKISDDKNL